MEEKFSKLFENVAKNFDKTDPFDFFGIEKVFEFDADVLRERYFAICRYFIGNTKVLLKTHKFYKDLLDQSKRIEYLTAKKEQKKELDFPKDIFDLYEEFDKLTKEGCDKFIKKLKVFEKNTSDKISKLLSLGGDVSKEKDKLVYYKRLLSEAFQKKL
jgi:hypothetical protein